MHINKPYPLTASVNLRDIGGYAARGGIVRRGVAFRADALSGLTPRDMEILLPLDIRAVIDLRSAKECADMPNSLQGIDGIEYLNIPLLDGIFSDGDIPPSLAVLYCRLLDFAQTEIANVLRAILGSKGAAVFHCTAGKDRTGVIAMLLLSLAGVSREVIAEDYAATWGYIRHRVEKVRELYLDLPEHIFLSEPENILAAMDHLDGKYHGVVEYLLQCGLTREELSVLTEKLVSRVD